MSAFVVSDPRGRVILATDDWVEAERVRMNAFYKNYPSLMYRIAGTHPSHEWADDVLLPGEPEFMRANGRCRKCGSPQGGCHMSHAPCGYAFDGAAWVTIIARELAARGETWSWRRS
jgi:hypothetical protein